jgi:hypothetical protein
MNGDDTDAAKAFVLWFLVMTLIYALIYMLYSQSD